MGRRARRPPVRPGAALLSRPGREPDRAELARCRDARPLALSGASASRRLRAANARVAAGGVVPRPEPRLTVGAPPVRAIGGRARSLALQARLAKVTGWALLAVVVVAP